MELWLLNIKVIFYSLELYFTIFPFFQLVEWSKDEYFNDVSFDIIKNCFLREYVIRNLSVGQKCYVRVSAGNIKGFGQPIIANPPYCVPSSMFSKVFFLMQQLVLIYFKIGVNFLKHHVQIYVIYVLKKFLIKFSMKAKEIVLVDHWMKMVRFHFNYP
jgi:hypothetical protein